MLAWIFRTLNAKIITTRLEMVRKPLKVMLVISRRFYLRSLAKSSGKTDWTVIDNFDGDISLKIDRSRAMGAALYWTGFHEFREFIFLHRFLRGNMTALDVGANLGEYTVFMAKRLTNGKVIAFEPLPGMRKQLADNVARNNFTNVVIEGYGLSDKDQVMSIHEIDDVHEGLATLYPRTEKSKNVYEASFKKLDHVIDSLGVAAIDFIKIDIEGSELYALNGARETIIKFKPFILIEINAPTYKAAGYSVEDVAVFFAEIKYAPKLLNKQGKLVTCKSLPDFGNVIFVPQ